ncbi:hypothetical protein K1Y77_11315 [Halomonas qaidamensis]|uniref:Polysaccharide chain length determinant N-terminal domain-containing protein n=1 Tax=Halomonas qaidamensis TaxID=2866211 RepID=A0ABY6JN77_9GAMM|nr:Wzz/FepE/Etk N-terminal domain-containing protein [Halomonas qaidamensis]UYV18075.1 hypothetical protein K1Y77_11315 [Halomonas qaidamensis]
MSAKTPKYEDRSQEITLVDLIKILVKKKVLVISIFILAILATLSYALIMPRSYQYTSVYQSAETAPNIAIESMQSLIAKTNNVYLDSLVVEYLDGHELTSMPFEIKVNAPKDTILLRLATQAEVGLADEIASFHKQLLDRVSTDQHEKIEKHRGILEAQLENIQQSIESLSNSNNPMTAELIARYSIQANEIRTNLANLIPGSIVHIASKSIEPVGPGKFFILIVGGLLSTLLAIGAAFLLSFIQLVRTSLENDS